MNRRHCRRRCCCREGDVDGCDRLDSFCAPVRSAAGHLQRQRGRQQDGLRVRLSPATNQPPPGLPHFHQPRRLLHTVDYHVRLLHSHLHQDLVEGRPDNVRLGQGGRRRAGRH